MNFYERSDLACESIPSQTDAVPGSDVRQEQIGPFWIREMRILDQEAAERLQKPVGHYLTVECGRIHFLGDEDLDLLVHLLSGRLLGMARRLTGKEIDTEYSVLVAGLGNAEMTADAVGPKTVGLLNATRHLREHEHELYRSIGCAALSALAPGVLGQTGIETLELLRGAVECVSPDLVVVVDALAARSCERLATTVQISDAGLEPGSGVGNHRSAISAQTLGVPVICIGVPTVVNSSTLVYDALKRAGIREPDEALKSVLESGKSFFVSPKECDVITSCFSKLLSRAISVTFTGV